MIGSHRELYLLSIESLYNVDVALITEFKQDDFSFVFESRRSSYIKPPPVTNYHGRHSVTCKHIQIYIIQHCSHSLRAILLYLSSNQARLNVSFEGWVDGKLLEN